MSYALIVQHPDLSRLHLPATARHFPLPPPEGGRLRLPLPEAAALPAEVEAELTHHGADFAVLPDLPFAHFGLLATDMDSTLITIECIDEIAARAGVKPQVATITERAMRGEMDFAQSLQARVALLKGLPESVLDEVYADSLRLSEGAHSLLDECRRHQVKTLLLSGGFTFFTEKLKRQLGLDWAYANELEIQNGRLTGRIVGSIMDAQAKADRLEHHRRELGLHPSQTLAVGDGANDIPMFRAAGIGIAYRAKAAARQAAAACINHHGLQAVRGWFA